MAKKSLSLCVSVFNLGMRVTSSITLSVLLEKSSFKITHSRSEIKWSGLWNINTYLSHTYIYIHIQIKNYLEQK